MTVAGKASERRASVATSTAPGAQLPAGGNPLPPPAPIVPPAPPAAVQLGNFATAAAAQVTRAVEATSGLQAAPVASASSAAKLQAAAAAQAEVANLAGSADGATGAAMKAALTAATALADAGASPANALPPGAPAAAAAATAAGTAAAATATTATATADTAATSATAATTATSATAATTATSATAATTAAGAADTGAADTATADIAGAAAQLIALAAGTAGKPANEAQAAGEATPDRAGSLAATAAVLVKQTAGSIALQQAKVGRSASAPAVMSDAPTSVGAHDAGSASPSAATATATATATAAAGSPISLDPPAAGAARGSLDAVADTAAARGARDMAQQRPLDAKSAAQASAAAGYTDDADAVGVSPTAATATAVAAPITALAAIVNGGDKHAQVDALAATASPALTPASDGTGATLQLTPDAPAAPAGGSTSVNTAKIEAPVGTPEFNDSVANRVTWMAGNNVTGATLQVSPPQLGPIELRVSIEAGHAQVWMSSHNPATLDALQSSSPKLREMLSSQGFQQVSVDVSQRSFQDNSSPYSQAQVWTPQPQSDTAAIGSEPGGTSATRASLGVLDAYA